MNLPVLLHAPHRVFFAVGTVQVLAAMAWWAAALAGGSAAYLHWPPAWVHGAWMVFGVFPPFMFGFLMTAMPRWQGLAPVAPRAFLASAALLAAGWTLFAAALAWPVLAGAAWLLILAGWLAGTATLARVAWAPEPDALHARLVVAALGTGALAVCCAGAALALGISVAMPWAFALALWGCVLPVFVAVAHRMIPFFTGSVVPHYEVVRPLWALYLLLAGSLAHGVLEAAGGHAFLVLADAPMLLAGAYLAWKWRPGPAGWAVRLLAMLHAGFAWLVLALALFVAQDLAWLAGLGLLGLAPLHALAIGFFGALLMAMVSRVTLGHSGRRLAADNATWGLFVALQAVALVRIVAEVLPPVRQPLLVLAAAGWLGVFAVWAWRYLPIYFRPRADGRPG